MGDPKRKHEEETPFDELPPITLGDDSADAPHAEQERELALHELPPIEYKGEEPAQPGAQAGPSPAQQAADPHEDEHGMMAKLMAFGDGLVGNWGGELAKAATRGARYLSPEGLSGIQDSDPERAGQLVDQASQAHPYYHGAGQAALGVGGAVAAGPAVGAQALANAAVQGGSEYGDSHSLPWALAKAGVGAVTGAATAKVAQGIGGAAGRPGAVPQVAPEAAMAPRPYAHGGDMATMNTYAGPSPISPQAAAEAAQALSRPSSSSWIDTAWDQIGRRMVPGGAPRASTFRRAWQAMDGLAGPQAAAAARAPNIPSEAARWGSIAALKGAGGMAGGAEEQFKQKLSANQSVVDWAVKGVLGGGDDHGLPPQDAQSLNQALMSGNAQKMSSLIYTLSDKYPAFAAAVAAQYKRANEAQESSR